MQGRLVSAAIVAGGERGDGPIGRTGWWFGPAEGDDLARPMADGVGDVVADDVENLPVVGYAPDHDMGVRMAGVVPIAAGAAA